MIYWQLFRTFFIVGLCSFGGGYAALPFIQNIVVDQLGWLTAAQFIDVVTISQMTPGPIGINAATFVGIQVSNILGAVVATVGFVFPSVIIVLILSYYYFKYRQMTLVQGVLRGVHPAVVALIASATWNIIHTAFWNDAAVTLGGTNWIAVAIAAVMLVVLRKTKLGPISIILLSGVLGVVVYSLAGV